MKFFDSAHSVAEKIIQGETSSTELVESCLARIKQHNPAINAIVTLDERAALESARRADALLKQAHENLPPLYGVPITVKDAFETAGLRTTSSHPPLTNHIPSRDATIVARLKSAGAIVLGKTNLPELAGDPQCWSPIFGPTHNPWNTALTPGGSSGGSAAAVAAGFSFLDPGSDIAGSIRIPAAYCGVAGLKATENRIPRTGHIPHLPTGSRSVRHLLSFGLLARCVDDLQLGLQLLAGPDGVDSEVPPLPVIAPAVIQRPLRIAWWDDFGGLPLCQRTRRALARTVEGLRQQGMTVERRSPAQFDFEKAWYAYGVIAGTEIGLGLPAMQRQMFSIFGHLVPASEPVTRAFLRGFSASSQRYNEALNLREHLIEQLEAFLGDWDAWLCPVASVVAYPHCRLGGFRKPPKLKVDERLLPYMEATIGWTTPFSLTGNPVVVLPAGIEDGLPVGFQWIGKRWHDELLLAVCAQIEATTESHSWPPMYA
ncbi:MAG: amidase [Burkholderiaceae bacterium]|jgi:amidase|nr:amidase [Burkholderiaceae bacterium]